MMYPLDTGHKLNKCNMSEDTLGVMCPEDVAYILDLGKLICVNNCYGLNGRLTNPPIHKFILTLSIAI